MTTPKLVTFVVFALWLISSGMAAEVGDAPEEIIVTGRQPGPPLWKVSSGDRVLWIFPYLDWIPKDMIWEDDRAARVNQMWLDAADSALSKNASTFAVLPLNELLAEDGLLSKLKASGYDIREP